jgi:thiosulfate reductase/polysulfide reductase chain A
MNVLVTENRYDKAFVEKYGTGFDKFATEIAQYTPEWAEAETGITAAMIRTTAREFSSRRPAAIVHPGRRVNWYGDDTQRSRAVALLSALLGNWGRKGGFYLSTNMKVAPYPLPKYPKSDRPQADNPDGARYPFADEGITTGLRDATLTGKPYPIKGWFVYSSNLLYALPNPAETLKAIDALDFLVVVDTLPSEIAGYADVVLPEAMFLERHDELLTSYGRQGWVALRQPVVPAPHGQLPGWQIAKMLADKLGIPESMPFKDMEEYLRYRVEKTGLSWDELKREGVIMGPKKPVFVEDGAELAFDTPTGKIEFWSKQLADKGFDPVPKFRRPADPPPGHFRLITGRAPVHTFSRTQNNPLLHDLMPTNEVWVNTDTAKSLGLAHGQFVTLRNQDGAQTDRVKVKATQRIRPDTVYIVYGFGHRSSKLRLAHGRGADAAQLNTKYETDPLMGGTSLHANFVTLVKEA